MDRVIRGVAAAIASFTAGATVIVQGIVSETAATVERFIGGSLLLGASIVVFRWLHQLLAAVREDNVALRQQLAEVTAKYEQERQLRYSLEEAGITDRRRHDEGDPQ